jgi:hypothetical protein
MSNNNNLYIPSFSDKFSITKIIDKIDFIKNCSTGIVLFTLISGLITFENYRHSAFNNEKNINKIISKINEKHKINESKIDELIETNKLIIKMLEKHDERLNEILQYPFITLRNKSSLQYSSPSLSDLSLQSEKEDENNENNENNENIGLLTYLNYCSELDETEKSVNTQESSKTNKISIKSEPKICKTEIEDEELLNECYDNFPCNNSKKVSGLNRLFAW